MVSAIQKQVDNNKELQQEIKERRKMLPTFSKGT